MIFIFLIAFICLLEITWNIICILRDLELSILALYHEKKGISLVSKIKFGLTVMWLMAKLDLSHKIHRKYIAVSCINVQTTTHWYYY